LSRPLVDVADLAAEDEAHRGLARRGHGGLNIPGGIVPQAVEAIPGRDKFLVHLREPAGMGNVAGGHDGDALELRPASQVLEGQVPAGGAGEMGMDVEVSNYLHAAEYSTTLLLM